jgi:glucose/arabinose dehydrogenase
LWVLSSIGNKSIRRLAALRGSWFGALAAIALVVVPSAQAISVPPGFQARSLPLPKATSGGQYIDGLQKPTTLDIGSNGKMFVAERNGRVLEFNPDEGEEGEYEPAPTLVLSILDKVMAKGDRGILGMKLDPEYPTKPYLYLSYTYDAPIGGDSALSKHTHYADGSDDCSTGSNSVDCMVSGRLVRVKLNASTSVAVGGPVDPSSEEVLVNSWCQQVTSHSIGDIEFDSEGALLMSGGEGATWEYPDYGELGNPCKDPPDEGGSLRAQDVRTPGTSADPTDYSGSIIRVNRETGAAMPNNPFSLVPVFNGEGKEDVRARRILAFGMRNPYRFTIQPGTGEVYIGDVGQDRWEEIDRVASPPALEQRALNFGWPCYEGGPSGNLQQVNWFELEMPLCDSLYENPSQVTAPFFAYSHPPPKTPGYDGHLFSGDECDPAPGSAIAGLAFYDTAGIPTAGAFPAEYDGTLFFSDAARGCIWTMREGPDGAPDPSTVANFAIKTESSESFTPVDTVEGPDGSLYIPNFYADSITQIRFAGPKARLKTDTTYGPLGVGGLTVHFDASGSTDSNGGNKLHYAWDLNGDGLFEDASDQAKVEHTYTSATNVTARVRVSDKSPRADVASVKLYPGDKGPPVVEIKKPSSSLTWALGEGIEYEATATDPDGDSLGSTTHPLTPHWEFTVQHCPSACHEHPLTSSDATSGTLTAEADGYPSHLRLEFTATDSRGLSTSEAVEVFPKVIEVTVKSDPPGIPVSLNGISSTGPLGTSMIAGESVTVSAAAKANISGSEYTFSAWSDGGARTHQVTSFVPLGLIARYSQPGAAARPGVQTRQSVVPGPFGRLRLVSKPAGVRLRVGAVGAIAPFSVRLPPDRHTYLLAPRSIERQGRVLHFERWMSGGRGAGTARRHPLIVHEHGRYVAVFGVG